MTSKRDAARRLPSPAVAMLPLRLPAQAGYPDRAIKAVVPFSPGGH